MKQSSLLLAGIFSTLAIGAAADAAEQQVRGKVVVVGGHEQPTCRELYLKPDTGGPLLHFRLGATNQENGLMAVAMTSLTTGLSVFLDYDPARTSGCGTEPTVIWMNLLAPGY